MNYDELIAGCELDALVAEKVMRLDAVTMITGYPLYADEEGFMCHVPHYSTNIKAAWEVVEEIRKRQWTVELKGHEWYDGAMWKCIVKDALNDVRARASDIKRHDPKKNGWDEPSAPLAICRAALKAIERNGENT